MIDVNKPIRFSDDRSKSDDYHSTFIEFDGDNVVLCYSKDFHEANELKHGMILFDKHSGAVLNAHLYSYIAENI